MPRSLPAEAVPKEEGAAAVEPVQEVSSEPALPVELVKGPEVVPEIIDEALVENISPVAIPEVPRNNFDAFTHSIDRRADDRQPCSSGRN